MLIGHERMREGLRVDPVIDGCPPFWAPGAGLGGGDASPARHHGQRARPDGAPRRPPGRCSSIPGGPAHTTGDLVAWLPDERVLFAGDLVFAGLTPLVFMGSVTGALAALDWLAASSPTSSSPGTGRCSTGGGDRRVLDEHRRYYRFVLAVAPDGRRRRAGPRWKWPATPTWASSPEWADAERLVLNLHRAYAEPRAASWTWWRPSPTRSRGSAGPCTRRSEGRGAELRFITYRDDDGDRVGVVAG